MSYASFGDDTSAIVTAPPQATSSFSLIEIGLGVIGVFGLIYLLTRSSGSSFTPNYVTKRERYRRQRKYRRHARQERESSDPYSRVPPSLRHKVLELMNRIDEYGWPYANEASVYNMKGIGEKTVHAAIRAGLIKKGGWEERDRILGPHGRIRSSRYRPYK